MKDMAKDVVFRSQVLGTQLESLRMAAQLIAESDDESPIARSVEALLPQIDQISGGISMIEGTAMDALPEDTGPLAQDKRPSHKAGALESTAEDLQGLLRVAQTRLRPLTDEEEGRGRAREAEVVYGLLAAGVEAMEKLANDAGVLREELTGERPTEAASA